MAGQGARPSGGTSMAVADHEKQSHPKNHQGVESQDMSYQRIAQAVKHACTSCMSERDIVCLARFCQRVAKHLLIRYNRHHLRNFARADYDADSAAWRCIETLFLPQGQFPCHEIRRYFSSNETLIPMATAEDIVVHLRRLIGRKVHQTVSEIYGELDQEFRKVLRNVTRHVKHSGCYSQRHSVNGVLVYRQDEVDILEHLPEFHEDDLRRAFLAGSVDGSTTPDLVDDLFRLLHEQHDHRRTLSLITIAVLVRDRYSSLSMGDDGIIQTEVQHLDHDVVAELISRTCATMEETLLRRYHERGGITREEGAGMLRALHHILEDWLNGERRPYHEHFCRQLQAISYSEYRSNHRARFEYLVRAARTELTSLAIDQLEC